MKYLTTLEALEVVSIFRVSNCWLPWQLLKLIVIVPKRKCDDPSKFSQVLTIIINHKDRWFVNYSLSLIQACYLCYALGFESNLSLCFWWLDIFYHLTISYVILGFLICTSMYKGEKFYIACFPPTVFLYVCCQKLWYCISWN